MGKLYFISNPASEGKANAIQDDEQVWSYEFAFVPLAKTRFMSGEANRRT